MITVLRRTFAGATLFLLVGQSKADFIGSSSGVFTDPVGPPTMVTSGVGTDTFTWGVGSPPSSLSFAGGGFNTPAEISFNVGVLTYYNGAIFADTGADAVELLLSLSFTTPVGVNRSFNYNLGLINTLNTLDPVASADYVTLSSVPNATFTDGINTYTLQLQFGAFSGLSFGGPNEFRVHEGATASVEILGKITTDLRGVPDHGSTLALLGLALVSVGIVRRRLAA